MSDNTTNNTPFLTEETQPEQQKNKNLNLQDLFLNIARKEHITITIFLMNGFQLKGVVKGFDTYVVIFEVDGKINMVYKHAISTITPSKPINVFG